MADDSDDIFAPLLYLCSLEKNLENLIKNLAQYYEDLAQFFENFSEQNLKAFKESCWEILEWCYTNEQKIACVIYLIFAALSVLISVLLRFDIISALFSMPAVGSSWNTSEVIPALLAAPHNFMAANSLPDQLIFAINALGISALFASIPIAIVMILVAAPVIPIAVPIALTIIPPLTDMISCGYQLYQAVKNDEPDVKEKALAFGYSSLMTIGFSLLCAATVTTLLCPALVPIALGLTIAGFACLAGSALLRVAYLMQKKPDPQPASNPTALQGNQSTFFPYLTRRPLNPPPSPSLIINVSAPPSAAPPS